MFKKKTLCSSGIALTNLRNFALNLSSPRERRRSAQPADRRSPESRHSLLKVKAIETKWALNGPKRVWGV